MGVYLVTCASWEQCPQDDSAQHVTRVGVSGPEGDRVLKVGAARLMLSSGDNLTIGSVTDASAELRKTRCQVCGAASLRTRKRDDDADLHAVPDCG
jgi:hypothetical protein